MKQLSLFSVFNFILLLILFNQQLIAQQNLTVNLSPDQFHIDGRNFYVLDVLDSRMNKQSIGAVPSGSGRNMMMLKFSNEFSDELQHFYNVSIPPDSNYAPVILQVNRLWVSEMITEDVHKTTCDVEMEFLTPNKKSLYIANVSEEYDAISLSLVRVENIEAALISCIRKFNNSDWYSKYLIAIEANTPTYIEPESLSAQFEEQKPQNDNRLISKDSKNFRLGIKGGWSYRLAKIPEGYDKELEDYIRKLLSGWNAGADISYFWNESNGAGLLFSNFMSSNTLSDVGVYDDDGNLVAFGEIKDDMNFLYIGPSYFYKQALSPSSIVHGSASLGYLSYKDNALVVFESLDLKGSTIGAGVSVGMDFLISDDIALGIELSAIMGSLSKLRINGVTYDLEEKENLTHLNISLLLHLYK